MNIESVLTSVSASASTSSSASTSASESASETIVTSKGLSEIHSIESLNIESVLTSASVSASTSASGIVKSTGDSRKQLPNTGSEDSNSSLLLGALAAITGLGLFVKRSKDENEDEI